MIFFRLGFVLPLKYLFVLNFLLLSFLLLCFALDHASSSLDWLSLKIVELDVYTYLLEGRVDVSWRVEANLVNPCGIKTSTIFFFSFTNVQIGHHINTIFFDSYRAWRTCLINNNNNNNKYINNYFSLWRLTLVTFSNTPS